MSVIIYEAIEIIKYRSHMNKESGFKMGDIKIEKLLRK